jgi:hypothetical protein
MTQKLKSIRKIFVVLILIAAVEGFSSCDKYSYPPAAVDPNQVWSFKTDIQPIFSGNCIECHNDARPPDLREGKSYVALTKGGYVKLPGETSRLYLHMSTNSAHIPRSSDTEKLKVLYWINQGAKNN